MFRTSVVDILRSPIQEYSQTSPPSGAKYFLLYFVSPVANSTLKLYYYLLVITGSVLLKWSTKSHATKKVEKRHLLLNNDLVY